MDQKIKELEQEVKELIEKHKLQLKIFGNRVYYDGFGAPKKLLEVLESEGASALKYLGQEDLYQQHFKGLHERSGVKNLPEFRFTRKPRK